MRPVFTLTVQMLYHRFLWYKLSLRCFFFFCNFTLRTAPASEPSLQGFERITLPPAYEPSIMLVFIFWSLNGTLTINNLVFYADIVLREAAIEFVLGIKTFYQRKHMFVSVCAQEHEHCVSIQSPPFAMLVTGRQVSVICSNKEESDKNKQCTDRVCFYKSAFASI